MTVGEDQDLGRLLRPDMALVRVRGFHRTYRMRDEEYTLTVYAVGEPREFMGRLEYTRFVAAVEWDPPAECGPRKDVEVFRKELIELQYRLPRGAQPVRVGPHTAAVVVAPVYHT